MSRACPPEQLTLVLPLPRGKTPTNRERRTLLSRLPAQAGQLCHLGIKRAIREAVRLRWVVWAGLTLHITDKGRAALAQLQAPRRAA